ncbi:hypothetical protein [Actinacidiphila glaucinigra]|uniref:hypothetical protein n=1 Tax=Actinacidiphila glaucinigra TaxID=235986 RepID=UPI00366C3C8B
MHLVPAERAGHRVRESVAARGKPVPLLADPGPPALLPAVHEAGQDRRMAITTIRGKK